MSPTMDSRTKESVLVTGGSGLVGRAIAEECVQIRESYNYVFLSSKDGDLIDPIKTQTLFEMHKPTYVINLAAKVGGLFVNMIDNDSFYHLNKSINENVLRCSSEFRVNKCISCLSTCIFPDKVDYPLDETKIHLGPPHSSNAGYSLAKRQVDLLNRKYNQLHPEQSLFTSVIPTNIYGCHDNFNLETSHVVPSLIHKAYLCATEALQKNQREATINVCGSGKPMRQFIYSKDLAKLILWILKNYTDTEPIILCPDETDEVSIGDLAYMIAELYGEKLNLKINVLFDEKFSDGQYKKTASNRKLRALYPDFQFTPLRTGIKEVIDWFCSTYPNVRS